MRMTAMSRIEELWEILKEYGIKTPEQFMEAYRRCPKIDIIPGSSQPKAAASQKKILWRRHRDGRSRSHGHRSSDLYRAG